MFISHVDEIVKKAMTGDSVRGVDKQVLVGPGEGWESHVMRLMTLTEGGQTPRHQHPWPHINYIVSGTGILFHEGEETVVTAGSVAYVPSGTEHQFRNNSAEEFQFICIVPKEGDK